MAEGGSGLPVLPVSNIRDVKTRFINQVVEIRNPNIDLDQIILTGLCILLKLDLGEPFESDLFEKWRANVV